MWWDSQNVRDAARIDLLSERGLSRDQEALFIGWNFSRFSAMFYATGNPRVLKIVRPWHPHTRALSGAVGESTVFEGKWMAFEGFQLILVVQYMRCAVCCALRYALHTYTYALRDNNVHVHTPCAPVGHFHTKWTNLDPCVRTHVPCARRLLFPVHFEWWSSNRVRVRKQHARKHAYIMRVHFRAFRVRADNWLKYFYLRVLDTRSP